MSQENVEKLRESFAIFNERGLEAAVAYFGHLLHPDFGIEEAAEMPDRENYGGGSDAFIANLRKLEGAFEKIRIEPVEFVDIDDQVVVVIAMTGKGRGSGAPVEMTFAQLWAMRDGKAVSLRDYATKADALEAAGLSE
jgi:ketosteroid isomerase-like protein